MIYISVFSLAIAITIGFGGVERIKHADRFAAVIGYLFVAIFAGYVFWLNNMA